MSKCRTQLFKLLAAQRESIYLMEYRTVFFFFKCSIIFFFGFAMTDCSQSRTSGVNPGGARFPVFPRPTAGYFSIQLFLFLCKCQRSPSGIRWRRGSGALRAQRGRSCAQWQQSFNGVNCICMVAQLLKNTSQTLSEPLGKEPLSFKRKHTLDLQKGRRMHVYAQAGIFASPQIQDYGSATLM